LPYHEEQMRDNPLNSILYTNIPEISDLGAKIGILGQGYVGLPLTMASARRFTIFGYDICTDTIENLKAGSSHIQDIITDEHLSQHLGKTYFPTSDPEALRRRDILIICVPTHRAKKYGFIPRFIETSGKINEFMKMHVINLADRGLRKAGKRLYGAKVAVMGLTYKKNISDPRESPAIKIIEELVNLGAEVRVYDPFVPSLETKAGVFTSAGSVGEALAGAECAVFLVDHDCDRGISMERVKGLMASPVVVDGKNLFEGGEGVVLLGIGKGEM